MSVGPCLHTAGSCKGVRVKEVRKTYTILAKLGRTIGVLSDMLDVQGREPGEGRTWKQISTKGSNLDASWCYYMIRNRTV